MPSFLRYSPSIPVSPSYKGHQSPLSLLKRDGYFISESQRKGGRLKKGLPLGSPRLSADDIGRVAVSSRRGSINLVSFCYRENPSADGGENVDVDSRVSAEREGNGIPEDNGFNVEVGNPTVPVYMRASRMSLGDQAFFLLAFVACTTSIAFTSLVVAAIPTLFAMGRAATSLSKLADAAREELPSTMAAIRLSGMEISDLTLELSDLSREIADGVTKSAQAVQAAEAGIRQIGALARDRTVSMIQDTASKPMNSLQPVVAGAARRTSQAVGHARRTFMNIISRREFISDGEDDASDRIEV
ncbi:uncharacterized protein LOC116249274 [Nymphaea colorata]|nr:uncharacterized protein LOC116249274 [Nymphaea colorata]